MVPASFDGADVVLSRPSEMTDEECEPLSIKRMQTEGGTPVVLSCWKLTQEELEEFSRTGRIWVTVYGTTMPPIALNGIRPF